MYAELKYSVSVPAENEYNILRLIFIVLHSGIPDTDRVSG